MSSFITTMFVSAPFPDPSLKALPPVFTLAQSSSVLSLNNHNVTCEPEEDVVFHSPRQLGSELSSLPPHRNRNARTRNQFKPRNTNKGSSSYQLRQFAEATLGSGSLRKAVKLPKDEDLNEWLAVNGGQLSMNRCCRAADWHEVVDFYNQINLLYGSITEFCSPQSCPEMKATDEYVLLRALNEARIDFI